MSILIEMMFYIFLDPRQWTESHVAHWLQWAGKEFSLENPKVTLLMKGRDILGLGRETFVARCPTFMGDILWEHLEILQKGKKNKKDASTYNRLLLG